MSDGPSDSAPQPVAEPLAVTGSNDARWRARQCGPNEFTLANMGFQSVRQVSLTSDTVKFNGQTEWEMIPGNYQVLVTTAEKLDPGQDIRLTWRDEAGSTEKRIVNYYSEF